MFTCTDAGLLDTSTDGRTIITAADCWELFFTKAFTVSGSKSTHIFKKGPLFLKAIVVSFLGCLPSK